MAIIYTYGFDDNVQDNDAWVGTNSGNRKTKQFSALSVANYMNRYGRVSIGGQMSYKLTSSPPGLGEMTVIGGGDGTNFVDIEFLNISTSDLSGAQVTEFLDYLVSTGLLISHQNNPSTFGHYTVVAYTPTADPSVYKLELGILGGNGKVFLDNYYDLSPLNLAGGTGSGVTTVDTSEGSFITLTPTTPTAGNVLITADLSATGTPDATTFLRGDNTWAVASEIDGSGTTNHVSKWQDPTTLTDSVIYDDGTNVGIGTSSPTDLLHLEGASTPTLKIVDTTNTTITELYSNDFDTYLANESSGRVFIRTGGSNGFVVDSAGDVGIGTTNPIYKLDIRAESPAIRIQDVSDANSFLVGADNSGGYLGMFTNDSLRVYTNSLERMRITSTGNVGIGTTNPTHALHAYGTQAAYLQGTSTSITVDGAGTSFFTYGTKAANIYGPSQTLSLGSGVRLGWSPTTSANSTQDTTLTRGDIGTLYLGNGTIGDYSGTLITGNIGIGTANPSDKLVVSGDQQGITINQSIAGNVFNGLDFTNFNGSSNAYIKLNQYTGEFRIQTGPSYFPTFYASGSEAMRINTSGNVGIGLTSPATKLDVKGPASGYVARFRGTNRIDIYDSGTIIGLGTGSGQELNLYSNDSLVTGVAIKTTGQLDFKQYGSGTFTGTATQRLAVDSSGNVIEIPIGSGPVDGSGTANYTARWTDADTIGVGSLYDDGTGVGIGTTTVYSNSLNLNNAGSLRIGNAEFISKDVNDMSIFQNKIRVTSTGNVGIGTTSPSAKLEVIGDLNLYNPSTISQITFRDIAGSNYIKSNGYATQLGLRGNAGNGVFILEDVFGTTQNLRIKPTTSGWDLSSAGVAGVSALLTIDTVLNVSAKTNVGIGTISPATKLEVAGVTTVRKSGIATPHADTDLFVTDATAALSSAQIQILGGNAGSSNLKFSDTDAYSSGSIDYSHSADSMSFRTNNNIQATITSTGNVGIGTTSPAARIQVDSTENVAAIINSTNTFTFLDLENDGINRVQIGNASDGDFIIRTADSERLRVNSFGNVGIGTSSPSQKLHVDGNARLTGAFYDSNNSAGAVGQVLTSTSTSTEWTDPGSMTQVPVQITAFAGGSLALAATVNFVYFSWLGGSGTYTLNLPSAVTYPYKVIRFVTDGGTNANNKIHIQGSGGQTVDGGVFYALDKAYNGVQVWSDGSEWIVIQAKAT